MPKTKDSGDYPPFAIATPKAKRSAAKQPAPGAAKPKRSKDWVVTFSDRSEVHRLRGKIDELQQLLQNNKAAEKYKKERDAARAEVKRLRMDLLSVIQSMATHGDDLTTYAKNLAAAEQRKKP